MQHSLLAYLRCPMGCDADLRLTAFSGGGEDVESGRLACGDCGRAWPIEEGIPRLLPDSLVPPRREDEAIGVSVPAREASEVAGRYARSTTADDDHGNPKSIIQNPKSDDVARQRAEMHARDAQAADYDRMWHLNLFGLIEVPLTLLNMNLGRNHLLLEGGCGTGRMTRQFAARCREMVSVDFSWESLRTCRAKIELAGVRNVHLIQADLCHLPLKTELFDRVVSCQVLEHIPSHEARAAAVRELARVLRSGGNLTLSAYQYSLLMRYFGEKEGEHDGGIPFFRFTREELRDLLEPWVRVESMTGALVYHYIARCTK